LFCPKNFDQRPLDLPHGEEALIASPSEGAGLVNCTDYEVQEIYVRVKNKTSYHGKLCFEVILQSIL
jgi:hypothetical protein